MNINIKINSALNNIDESILPRLKQEIKKLNNKYIDEKDKVAYYYKDIKTGSILSYNDNILFYAASAIKVLVCVLLLEDAENKKLDLNKKILVSMNDLKQGTGIIKDQSKDTYYSIQELIEHTIVESDNTAYIKLVNFVGKEKLIAYGRSLGAIHTLEGKDLFGLINCSDMLIYWEKIYNFIHSSKKYGPIFYKYLSNPIFSIVDSKNIGNNNYIKKYGSFGIAYHEAGYVEDENPFYLIILTQKNERKNKKEFVNETARRIYKIHKLIHKKS